MVKVFSQTPVNPDELPAWIRIRPDLKPDEARSIAKLPEIKYAAIWAQITRTPRVRRRAHPTVGVVIGADDGYPEI